MMQTTEKNWVVMLEDVDEVMETMQIEEEPPIGDEIQPIETFVECESITDFKKFEALHNTILNINNRLLCSDVQTEVGQMHDELRRWFETFHENVNKLTLNVKCEKFMCLQKITVHDLFKQ